MSYVTRVSGANLLNAEGNKSVSERFGIPCKSEKRVKGLVYLVRVKKQTVEWWMW